jgi:hypothetical protein
VGGEIIQGDTELEYVISHLVMPVKDLQFTEILRAVEFGVEPGLGQAHFEADNRYGFFPLISQSDSCRRMS